MRVWTPPVLGWARGYERGNLRPDVLAGFTIAVLLVPQGMAYASIAGMPPITGLYAAIVALTVYAVLGTSSHLSVGPVAIVSLLTAAALDPLAGGQTARYVALAALLALLVGVTQLVMGLLRLGALVSFLSHPVISGFTSAAAIVIGFSQARDLLGLDVPRSEHLPEAMRRLVAHAAEANPWSLGIGLGAITVMLIGKRLAPRAPVPLVLVVLTTALTWALGLADRGVIVLGEVPAGLPGPTLPAVDLTVVRQLWVAALTIALVGYAESISIAKAIATRTRERLDPNAELVAQGGINLASGVFSGFPVAGSFTRTALTFASRAHTQLAGLVAAGILVVTVVVAAPLFSHLPRAMLAAIVIVAVVGLVDVQAVRESWATNRDDGVALVTTFAATLGLGVEAGLLTGITFSLGLHLYRTTHPRIVEVGRVKGSTIYRDVHRYPTTVHPGIVVLRLDGPLTFMAARSLEDRVLSLIADRAELDHLILDTSAMVSIDATGSHALHALREELDDAGVLLHLAIVRSPVRETLQRAGLWADVTGGHTHPDLDAAVACALRPDPPDPPDPPDDPEDRTESPRRPQWTS
jgi:sulfate permease, SulP family